MIKFLFDLGLLVAHLIIERLERGLFSHPFTLELVIFNNELLHTLLQFLKLLLTDGVVRAHHVCSANVDLFALALNEHLLLIQHLLQLQILYRLLLVAELFLVLFGLEGQIANFGFSPLILFIEAIDDARELGDFFLKFNLLGC